MPLRQQSERRRWSEPPGRHRGRALGPRPPRPQAELGTKLGTGPREPLGILAAGIRLRDTHAALGGGNGRCVFDPECPMSCGRARHPGQDALHVLWSQPRRHDTAQHRGPETGSFRQSLVPVTSQQGSPQASCSGERPGRPRRAVAQRDAGARLGSARRPCRRLRSVRTQDARPAKSGDDAHPFTQLPCDWLSSYGLPDDHLTYLTSGLWYTEDLILLL